MEHEIIGFIKEQGPIPGAVLWDCIGGDGLTFWRQCMLSKHLSVRRSGTRYLRLDRNVEGYARLSPSLWREFLTYSVVGLKSENEQLTRGLNKLRLKAEEISKAKLDLAYQVFDGLINQLNLEWTLDQDLCVIIAGDIVYNMAHDVPRPERSTGKLVRGSDLDIVAVVSDSFQTEDMKRLDDAIFKEKYRLLITPHLREEIDYVVKRMEKVSQQIQFDSFKHMVACKILREGTLLYGSETLFGSIKGMLKEHGIMAKLNDLERKAYQFREAAEHHLLTEDIETIEKERLWLFYPSEESEEFE
jgi:hypothetical protein